MSIRKDSEVESIQGNEGTKVKQYFHPHDTPIRISYSLAQFTLEPGKKSRLHKIKSSEIYYILEGTGIIHIDDGTYPVENNDAAYVPPNAKQFIENSGNQDLRFLCIVETAWKMEDETLLE